MRKLDISRDAYEFVSDLDGKQYRQVVRKAFSLLTDSEPADASKLKGYDDYWRVDIGEYRIIYHFDDETVYVSLIGKRNDEVYRDLGRK